MATRREIDQTAFLYGGNTAYIEELFERYLADPSTVDVSWRSYFDELGPETKALFRQSQAALAAQPKPAVLPQFGDRGYAASSPLAAGPVVVQLDDERTKRVIRDHLRVIMLIRAYRVRGHLAAKLDPLGLTDPGYHPELDYRTYGFTDDDLNREFYLDHVLGLEKATLQTIVEILRKTYSSTVGIEFLHIQDPDQKAWLQARIEGLQGIFETNDAEKREVLRQMTAAEGFESFLHVKFPGTKRFGLDGGESAIACVETIIRTAAPLGVDEIVIGMPHRGRLNVLANVMGKPYAAIFSEFQGYAVQDEVLGSGDVKYHLGTSTDRELPDGSTVHMSLTANPSHLEAVNPVVLGKVRAKQRQKGDLDRSRVMGVLFHGDAAFAGQGVVHEGFEMSELKGYRTGGTIHIVVNNQIGFTTSPSAARSSPYPSDVARGVQAPIFHVNGDDPIAVVHVARLAAEFRQRFKRDVVIDLWCYRRHGHNEGDEPSFTQPLMYRRIAQHPTCRQLLVERLVADGIMSREQCDEMHQEFQKRMEAEHAASKSYKTNKADWLEGVWSGLRRAPIEYERGETALPEDRLREIGLKMTSLPEGLKAHSRLKRVIGARHKAIVDGQGIDWATAEHLAFGSLAVEGFPIRLSGQDVGRGTFSQRHAVITDQETEETYLPLQHLTETQASVEIVNSFLSEEGVLGFEYGYSLSEPNGLTLWEAQFGDFANGAQVYFDQFISSGESKWLRMSGLVCLLPHGYEGQGPEHSSARLERFLQLYAEDNIQVVYPSTPASYFHVLRRQLHRKFRKPLIVMTPKSLLRHKRCVSSFADLTTGSAFHRVLYDRETSAADAKVERIVLCTGKVYYDLKQAAEDQGIDDKVAFLRLEQIAPFPETVLAEELNRYPRSAKVVWCQEEPRNMGAWFFVQPRLHNMLEEQGFEHDKPIYAGRAPAASTACGFFAQHVREQERLVADAFSLDR
ncbi:MAG: 2-oxoglutarate dehydrogenase E1 component [Geminicoccaceae bacterium]|nr:MAG: 2-oxoglutarate dehydrogenase E1 component [Geminicoccaceae bacterium]